MNISLSRGRLGWMDNVDPPSHDHLSESFAFVRGAINNRQKGVFEPQAPSAYQ